ncbi:hypothetical protein HKX48_001731 [Thoreauomyces humboldtii]|nr:hypothetical protein HKX48_001731 [Thoreauomyces humboldtii]
MAATDAFVPSVTVSAGDSANETVVTKPVEVAVEKKVDTRLAESLRRARTVTEQKLSAQRRWGAFEQEEITVFEANIKEARHMYEQQLEEQRRTDDRQQEAAMDLLAGEARKSELVNIVCKIAAVKNHLNAQEEAKEREIDFRAKQKQKRSAFEKRNKVIEAAQIGEREDLVAAQERSSRNLKAINTLELRGMTEANRQSHNQEFQVAYQQLKMRQQKEAEQLRELQLLKVRHMSEQMEMELLTGSEVDSMITEHRVRENRLLADQVIERAGENAKLDRQQAQLKALQLKEEQKLAKGDLLHNQVRQRKVLDRTQRSSARVRERGIADETAALLAEIGQSMIEDASAPAVSDRDTSEMPSESATSADDNLYTGAEVGGSDMDLRRKARSKHDAAAELTEALAKGVQRVKMLEVNHRKLVESMRSQHKDQMQQKLRELKRKQGQLLKDQEDEVMTIRREQVADMDELFDLIQQAQDLNAEQRRLINAAPTPGLNDAGSVMSSQNLMPASFTESIRSGFTPVPSLFAHATVIRTGIAGFDGLTPHQIIPILQRLAIAFEEVMQTYPDVTRVEQAGESYVLCAGLNSEGNHSDAAATAIVNRDVWVGLECARSLQERVGEIDVSDLNLPTGHLALRIGVEHGAVKAGLLGTRSPHFRILGETVDRAAQICAVADHAGILVGENVHELAGGDYQFERGTDDGTFWLTGGRDVPVVG